MKKVAILLMIVTLLAGGLFAYGNDRHIDFNSIDCNGRNYEFEDDCIYIYNDDYHRDYIKITEDLELYINGREIETNYFDRRILDEYYDGLREIREMAKELGYDGAKLGLKGAVVGIKAVAKIPMIILGKSDEFEKSIEQETEKIEREAEEIEERGEEIEKMADEVDDCEYKLKKRIEELDDLGWF